MRIDYLSGLRGICAVAVVFFHFLMGWLPAALDGRMSYAHMYSLEAVMAQLPFYAFGNFPVCIFFVLSGYVLSMRYWREGDASCLTGSALGRYLRLTGPVLGSCLLAWLLMKLHWLDFAGLAAVSRTEYPFFAHVDMHFRAVLREALWGVYFSYDQTNSFNPVLWTMQVELYGSFLAFSFLALCGWIRRRDLIYAVLAIMFIWPQTYLLSFVPGVWLADIAYAADRSALRERLAGVGALPAAALLLGLYCGFYADDANGLMYGWLYGRLPAWLDHVALMHIWGAALLIYACTNLGACRRFLGWRGFVLVGDHSFSLYLVHVPILLSAGRAVFFFLLDSGWSYGAAAGGGLLASLPVMALAVLGLHYCFDRPFAMLAKRFSKYMLANVM